MGIEKYREIEDPDELIDTLIKDGLIEMVGLDDDGVSQYMVTDKGREVLPERSYEDRVKAISKDAYDLWMLDMVEIRFVDGGVGNDYISLTEHAFDKEKIAALPVKLKYALSNMKKAFAQWMDS